MEISADHKLSVVEDAAQAVNARYRGRYLGTIGDFGCYSFHETKNYTCGEGGALLINSEDPEILERAEVLREKGTNRNKFDRGEVDKYTWVDIGSSYLPSDILAAVLYAQLEKLDEIQKMRMEIWDTYNRAFKPFEERGMIRLPVVPRYAEHNAHLFYIIFRDEMTRDLVMSRLKSSGIRAVFHYVPLHSSPMGLKMGSRKKDLPVTEEMSSRLLRFPIYAGMEHEILEYIVQKTISILKELE
ncbi:MAG: TDP-4-oxo-6-deoxy-D-glucose transaminase [Methanoregula sp. PtaU1.Bin006]|nr:MAG: TDP-4-oxo-6-deoxy-D-glucose transaminase [Methanoregula sp. PtaU1.Bin006]